MRSVLTEMSPEMCSVLFSINSPCARVGASAASIRGGENSVLGYFIQETGISYLSAPPLEPKAGNL